jgi:hypothetical protein
MTVKKKYPQRAPKRNYFAELSKTAEGRAKRAEWAKKPRKNPGRPAGVPHGYTKETIEPLRAKAKQEAERFVQIMSDNGEAPEDDFAKEALKTAVEVMRVPGETRERLAAARLVLDFTKQKPASKSDVTIGKAEGFLEGLLEQEEESTTDGPKAAEDTEEAIH